MSETLKNPVNPAIFIIDPNQSYRIIIRNLLQALNFSNLFTFSTIEEFIDLEIIPDIIILDHNLGLGKQSGLDFLRRNKYRYPKTRFFFLSSNADPVIAIDSIRWGASEYILKNKTGLTKLASKLEGLLISEIKDYRNDLYLKAAIISLCMFSIIFILGILFYNLG
jgi:DNA-binding NarL/FixJ family response regulator